MSDVPPLSSGCGKHDTATAGSLHRRILFGSRGAGQCGQRLLPLFVHREVRIHDSMVRGSTAPPASRATAPYSTSHAILPTLHVLLAQLASLAGHPSDVSRSNRRRAQVPDNPCADTASTEAPRMCRYCYHDPSDSLSFPNMSPLSMTVPTTLPFSKVSTPV